MIILPPVEEVAGLNENPVLHWNHAGLELNRLTHSLSGPQTGPPLSARALGILHLAIHDAYFAIASNPDWTTYLSPQTDPPLPDKGGADDAVMAVAGAAITVLNAFYSRRSIETRFSIAVTNQIDQLLQQLISSYPNVDALSESYQFGVDVGLAILDLLLIHPNEPGVDTGNYRPKNGRYFFRDDPSNPVKLVPVDPNNPGGPQRVIPNYHAPFYGMTAKRFAVQSKLPDKTPDNDPANDLAKAHIIADPPKSGAPADKAEYMAAVREVIALGGAPELNKTVRSPNQTVNAYFWAYDGANLIGTPPRLYNQILRQIAWKRKLDPNATAPANTADFARLFALANTALADAGILCWREKYCHEFWRPLSGVREHDTASGPAADPMTGHSPLDDDADPFWLTLGAPETNTDRVSFKPPFPAYPSGHATFGAAMFQIVRLYYKHRDGLPFEDNEPDNIAFDFVSDELNGINRDLRQPYDASQPITNQPGIVRTRVVRHFKSLWAAILDNAVSRVYLGVHWRFDAFASRDVIASTNPDGSTIYKDSDIVRYTTKGSRTGLEGEYPIGGVPLGIGIANDIFAGGLRPTLQAYQPTGRHKCGPEGPTGPEQEQTAKLRHNSIIPKVSQTNIR